MCLRRQTTNKCDTKPLFGRNSRSRELSDSRLRLPVGSIFQIYTMILSQNGMAASGVVVWPGDASSKYVPTPRRPSKLKAHAFTFPAALFSSSSSSSSSFPLSLFSRFYSWLSLKEPRGEAQRRGKRWRIVNQVVLKEPRRRRPRPAPLSKCEENIYIQYALRK